MFISSVQDAFLTTVSKKKETVNRTSSKRKRGWFTIEGMKTKLKWSKQLARIILMPRLRYLEVECAAQVYRV